MIHTFTFLWAQVSMAFMLLFIWHFVPTRYHMGKRLFIMAIIYTGCTFIDYFQYFVLREDITQVVQSALEALIVQGCVFWLCKYKDFRALFAGLTAAVVILVGNIVAILLLLVSNNIAISLVGQILVHCGVMFALVRSSKENWLWLLGGTWKNWRELCSIPLLFWLVIYSLTVWPQSVWRGENSKNMLAVMFLLVLLEISYFIMLSEIAHQYRIAEVERDKLYLENYAAQLKREADNLREQESETAVIRHDLRHYLRQIQAYITVGDIEEVNSVLEQLNQKIIDVTPKRYCENLAVNGVITYCKTIAEWEGVELAIEAEVPQHMAVNEFEFATVVSNLLENAVHAAAKVSAPDQRRAGIKVHGVKRQMMLEISNSYAELPKLSEETGLPLSQNGKDHGYGLKSVLAFAAKNDAIFDYEIEDNVVTIRMLV